MYQLLKDPFGVLQQTIKRLSDTAFIPFAPDNTDYQAYLKWLSDGNTPLPPDNN
jgi:hypothetical protein